MLGAELVGFGAFAVGIVVFVGVEGFFEFRDGGFDREWAVVVEREWKARGEMCGEGDAEVCESASQVGTEWKVDKAGRGEEMGYYREERAEDLGEGGLGCVEDYKVVEEGELG